MPKANTWLLIRSFQVGGFVGWQSRILIQCLSILFQVVIGQGWLDTRARSFAFAFTYNTQRSEAYDRESNPSINYETLTSIFK